MARVNPQEYARAIYEKALDGWVEQLRTAQQTLSSKPDLRTRLRGAEDQNRRREVLREALPDSVQREAINFLALLAEDGQLGSLEEVIRSLRTMAQRGKQQQFGQVISAVELTEEEKDKITEKVRRRFGAETELSFVVDPSIIGGVVVRVGDQVIDMSVATRLANLKSNLMGAS